MKCLTPEFSTPLCFSLNVNPGERHSRDTRDDGTYRTVTLCTLRAAAVMSHDCRADFGRPLTKVVTSHSRDGPGVTAPLRTNIVPLTGVWNPPLPSPPLKNPRLNYTETHKTTLFQRSRRSREPEPLEPFNLKGAEKKRTLQKHPFGQPFLCTTPSPLLWRTLIIVS